MSTRKVTKKKTEKCSYEPKPVDDFEQMVRWIRRYLGNVNEHRRRLDDLEARLKKAQDDLVVILNTSKTQQEIRDVVGKQLEVDDLAVRLSKGIRAAQSAKINPRDRLSDSALEIFVDTALADDRRNNGTRVFVNDEGVRYFLARVP